jgi:H+/Cl- antiporter ClcA
MISFFRLIIICLISAAIAAASVSFFITSLKAITDLRDFLPGLIYFLPLAGLIIGIFNHKFGRVSGGGLHLILEEVKTPRKILSWMTAPLIYLGTLFSHLVGASTGREGAAVQIGTSLADQLNHFFSLNPFERRTVLSATIATSFGVAIGAPLAGIIFAWEICKAGRWRSLPYFILATLFALKLTPYFGLPHISWRIPTIPLFSLDMLWGLPAVAIAMAFIANIFIWTHSKLDDLSKRYLSSTILRGLVGSSLLLGLFLLIGNSRYAGLGLNTIEATLQGVTEPHDMWYKLSATILSLVAGLKGGEFTPLVFIGSSLGAALSQVLPFSFDFLAVIGFVTIYGCVMGAPWTMAVMAAEIFSPGIFPYALIVTSMASLLTRRANTH